MGERPIALGRVMFQQPSVRIVRGTDVKPPLGVLQNVNPKQTRQVGLEPTTSRLTAGCSTIELLPKKIHSQRPSRLIPTCRDSTIELLPKMIYFPKSSPGSPSRSIPGESHLPSFPLARSSASFRRTGEGLRLFGPTCDSPAANPDLSGLHHQATAEWANKKLYRTERGCQEEPSTEIAEHPRKVRLQNNFVRFRPLISIPFPRCHPPPFQLQTAPNGPPTR